MPSHNPDDNTETASSAVDAKSQAGASSATEDTQKSSPLAEAMKVAGAAEGGDGEQVADQSQNEEADEKSRSKIEQDGKEASTEGEENENAPEGDEEQDEKVQENETEKSDDEPEEGAEEDKTDKTVELTKEQKEENERFDKHPRFQELNKKVKDLEPLAETQRGIETFCKTHGVTGEQFKQALQMAALMNVDPVKARAALLPIMENLNAYVGEKLPEELQKRVDAGTLDVNDAKEMARLRAQATMTQTRSAQTQEQVFNASCAKAVSDWETSKKALDPDYDKKYDLIEPVFMGMLQAARVQGKEPSPQDRVRFAEQAWKQVTDKLIVFMPKRPIKKSFKTNGSRTTGTKEASSPEELAMQIAARAK